MGKGWLSFVIAAAVYVGGYWVIAGRPPGVAGATEWWSLVLLFVLWGTVGFVLFRKRDE